MNPGTLGSFFGRIAAGTARRAWLVLAVGLLIAAAAVAVIATTGMKVQAVDDAIFNRDSAAYVDTAEAEKTFGSDPVIILVKGDLIESLKPENLKRLNVLEQCVAGGISRGRGKLFEICDRIAEIDPVKVAAGPATFLTRAVAGITGVYQQQLKRIRSLPEGSARARQGQQQMLSLAAEIISKYGLTSLPSLDDPTFINKVVYGDGNIARGPKPKLSYLFPNADSAQIVLRLRSNLTDDERSETIDLIRRATEDQSTRLSGAEYVITGSPVIFDGLSESLQTGVALLAVVALVLMSISLALAFGSAWRLLPLGLAVGAITIAFGLLRVAGGSVSLAALGAVPILIGLTVDYAVQIQARYDESDRDLSPPEAARVAASLGLPMIGTACLASALGFGALLVSSVPLISEFGLLLACGVLVCLLVVFIFGFAALSIRGPGRQVRIPFERFSWFGFVRSGAKSILGLAILAPGRLLLVSLLIAACGWAAGTQAEVRSELTQFLPTRTAAVQDFVELEDSTGTSGEVDLIVRSDDVTDPGLVAWMADVRRDILEKAGYDPVDPNCVKAELCPGPAIVDFVPDGGRGLTARDIRQTLKALPPMEREAMVAGRHGRKALPTETKIPFVIRAGSVDRQAAVIESIRESVAGSRGGKGPPAGASVELAGLPVVVNSTISDLADSRYKLAALAILAVGLVLLLIYRSFTRMLVPLIPIVVAGGWSAVIISSLGISLNPLSTILAVLVTAISTEFSVILAGRYFQVRESGAGIADALRFTYGRTGMAIAASGVTAIAGFAALASSDIAMLREFGLVAVVDLSVALLGVAIVLPAVLAWLERR